MKQEHWNDEQIEALLKQAPKMQDARSKEEVFSRLQESGAFKPEQPVLPQKKFHWKSMLVSIASIFVLVLIASNYIGTTPDIASDQAIMESAEDAGVGRVQDTFSGTPEMARTFMVPQRTALYPNQVGDSTVLTIGLAGDDAESVPVTILIPQSQMIEDFGDEVPTKLALYNKYAPQVNEEALGFNSYHPLGGTFVENETVVTHQLPETHQYDRATATMSNYIGVMIDTFQDGYKEIHFTDEQGNPVTFDQAGEPATPLDLHGEETQYNYFLYTMRDGSQYISPNFRMSYAEVESALANMTVEANDIYQTLILPNVSFKTAIDKDIVTITFDEPLDLDQQDGPRAMQMIEGILLTAANFDKKVYFKNILQEQWYDFDFTKPLPVPVAPNLLDFSWVFQ